MSRADEMTDEAKRLLLKAHGGFRIVCERCGCDVVEFDNSMGWSAESGGWGSFDLVCCGCGHSVELMGS